MATADRSIGSILGEIADALQDLLRAELALARREVAADLSRVRSALAALVAGSVAALLGAQLLLWSAVYALALRLPLWGAAAIVGGVLALTGALVVSGGLRRWRDVTLTPERTVATLKENVAWLKPSSR